MDTTLINVSMRARIRGEATGIYVEVLVKEDVATFQRPYAGRHLVDDGGGDVV